MPTPAPIAAPPPAWPHAPGELVARQVSGSYWQVRDANDIIVATVYSSNPAAAANAVGAVLDYARCRAAADAAELDAAVAAMVAEGSPA